MENFRTYPYKGFETPANNCGKCRHHRAGGIKDGTPYPGECLEGDGLQRYCGSNSACDLWEPTPEQAHENIEGLATFTKQDKGKISLTPAKVKLRRQIEDALRKTATEEQLRQIAGLLNVAS